MGKVNIVEQFKLSTISVDRQTSIAFSPRSKEGSSVMKRYRAVYNWSTSITSVDNTQSPSQPKRWYNESIFVIGALSEPPNKD